MNRTAPANVRRVPIRPFEFIAVVAPLGLFFFAAYLFRIEESTGFLSLSPIIFAAFIIHALTPFQHRLTLFAIFSLATFLLFHGPIQGIALIFVALGIIGLCHLPIPFSLRASLVAGAAVFLALVRTGTINTPWANLPVAIIPALGIMFMFRMVLYLYDLRHEKGNVSIAQRLSYFFLLPTVCFPLFPVLDFSTLRRVYYDRREAEIYQKGVSWIGRGITHLLLYRLVYHHLTPDPSAVDTFGGVLLYMVSAYLLYLRISGLFHLIIGILCLFGFNLPETHHYYYFASSFTDFWRRINIYWKDFMMKLVYYPLVMKYRRIGMNKAIVIATLATLNISWILHSYQWFWLQGGFPIHVQDAVFWPLLGVLVAINSVWESKRGGVSSLKKKKATWAESLRLSAQTAAFFCFMTVLWSFWTCGSVSEWVSVLSVARTITAAEFAFFVAGFAALVAAGTLVHRLAVNGYTTKTLIEASFPRYAAWTAATAAVLVMLGEPRIVSLGGSSAADMMASLKGDRLNRVDTAHVARGYYEELLDTRSTGLFWRVQAKNAPPPEWDRFWETEAARRTGDVRLYELVPGSTVSHKNVTITINRWGMRDNDYERAKPLNTFRIALLGDSYTFGSGAELEDTFQAVAETRFAREITAHGGPRLEILNFAAPGYAPFQQIAVIEQQILDFQPDAIFYVCAIDEDRRVLDKFNELVREGADLSYDYLRGIANAAGVHPELSSAEIRKRLHPHAEDMVVWGYASVVEVCNERGIPAVWLFAPRTVESPEEADHRFARFAEPARKAGFEVWTLGQTYGDYNRSDLIIAEWDEHPNTLGHTLLGDRLFELVVEHHAMLGLDIE